VAYAVSWTLVRTVSVKSIRRSSPSHGGVGIFVADVCRERHIALDFDRGLGVVDGDDFGLAQQSHE
jgi:hypothetical protein